MMTIYSDSLHWSGITPMFYHITDLNLITEFDFLPNCERWDANRFLPTESKDCMNSAFVQVQKYVG